VEDYERAFAALGKEDVRVLVCDSGDEAVQQALRSAVESASALRRERIAVVGCDGAGVTELIARAEALNSERMVLVGPDALDSGGNPLSGVFAAAAVAALAAAGGDPAVTYEEMLQKKYYEHYELAVYGPDGQALEMRYGDPVKTVFAVQEHELSKLHIYAADDSDEFGLIKAANEQEAKQLSVLDAEVEW